MIRPSGKARKIADKIMRSRGNKVEAVKKPELTPEQEEQLVNEYFLLRQKIQAAEDRIEPEFFYNVEMPEQKPLEKDGEDG